MQAVINTSLPETITAHEQILTDVSLKQQVMTFKTVALAAEVGKLIHIREVARAAANGRALVSPEIIEESMKTIRRGKTHLGVGYALKKLADVDPNGDPEKTQAMFRAARHM